MASIEDKSCSTIIQSSSSLAQIDRTEASSHNKCFSHPTQYLLIYYLCTCELIFEIDTKLVCEIDAYAGALGLP